MFVYQTGMAKKTKPRGPGLLSTWMKNGNLTQVRVAKKLRCSQPYVSEMLAGLKVPSMELATRIEKVTASFVAVGDWVRL